MKLLDRFDAWVLRCRVWCGFDVPPFRSLPDDRPPIELPTVEEPEEPPGPAFTGGLIDRTEDPTAALSGGWVGPSDVAP